MQLAIQPISHESFAPFGELVAHRGDAMRRYLDDAHEHAAPADALRFWVSRYPEPRALPVAYPKLERHPFSAQTFIPLTVQRYVVIAAPTAAGGAPDIAGLRAFLVGPGVGVTYRRATWHGPMTVLDGPAEFAVAMWSAGGPERDDEWFTLPEPLRIVAA
ncbi:MAG: ureidoglycolate lyase [Alphaproteobacteria bacterium]|nr:ureidoglycolate lyase [Alphaproteobacteria bacterium]